MAATQKKKSATRKTASKKSGTAKRAMKAPAKKSVARKAKKRTRKPVTDAGGTLGSLPSPSVAVVKEAASAPDQESSKKLIAELKRAASAERHKLGRLGIMLVGANGAIASTVRVGIELFKRGLYPVSERQGILSQTGTIRIGDRDSFANIYDVVPVADFEDMVVGGWDINKMDAYQAALYAKVLDPSLVERVAKHLKGVKPYPGYFDKNFVRNLDAEVEIKAKTKWEAAQRIIRDIEKFKKDHKCDRVVVMYVGSTERYHNLSKVHKTLGDFEKGLKSNHKEISPGMIYAYAAFRTGSPHHNFSPSLCSEIPALRELARREGVPFSGNDGKTGQTWLKSVIMPGFKGKDLWIQGWASNNWIGNKDGLVLDEPGSFETKRKSKSNQARNILGYDIEQPVLISYYKIAGDEKHAMDRVDFSGFLGYKMIIDISFFCRDSILAAPMVIDLARFLDFGMRRKMAGVQEWLSMYSKSPIPAPGKQVEHDFFIQREKFENTVRELIGAPIITHLGQEYWARSEG